MRIRIYGIDVDDVLLRLVPHWLIPYNYDWNDNLKYTDIRSWDFSSYVKPECGVKIYDYLTPELYEGIPVVDGALDGVNRLRELGRVIFVTSNMGNNSGVKLNKLNEHGFNVLKKDYVEASDKSIIKYDWLLDDSYDNFVSADGRGVLFSMPWNLHNTVSPRVRDWNEAVRFFEKEAMNER